MARSLILFLLFTFYIQNVFAQSYVVTGRVLDSKDTLTLIGVTAVLTSEIDTTQKKGAVTDENGNFTITGVADGRYNFKLIYLGYNTVSRSLTVAGGDVALGTIRMSSVARELKGVTISGQQIRAEQRGDTSQFNAGAYKTNPDADAEDLVKKMPGITSDEKGVKVNGETVQQVYVDGKPFFGTDPSLALKNLPAEVIDKIQVFDKLSDQSSFTGFDDGNGQKTINIITRKNKGEGIFGKVYAGYGTDDRYIAGGNLNIFNGQRRISILGLSNNINQQNFSTEDIVGATGGSGQTRGGRGSSGRSGGSSGWSGGGNSSNNFLVGQQGGIATTHALGFNYSDNWGKKVKVTGSYFYNSADNVNSTLTTRNYFTSDDTTNIYNEISNSESKNINHRVNMRLEYTIDSFNSITFTPGISFQQYNASAHTIASTTFENKVLSRTLINSGAKNEGFNGNGNLLIQHKFQKPRRTISLNLNTALNEKEGDGSYFSESVFDGIGTTIDQQYTLFNNRNNVSGNLTYTEPIGKSGQIMANYNPSVTESHSDKLTYNLDTAENTYTNLDPKFSNQYDNTYVTHRGGLSYRVGDKKLNFNVGVNGQYATLKGEQTLPQLFTVEKEFKNILPNAMFNYRYGDGRNLRIMYRTSTNPPSVTQLQNVVDITNPLILKTGNADLKQDFEQTFIVRYGATKSKNSNSLFANLFANYITDYIGNATYMPTTDSVFKDAVTNTDIIIKRGSQLTRPVNLDGYASLRSFVTYGFPVKFLKSNLNLNAGFNYTRAPGLINNYLNYSNNYIPSGGVVLSSNISENVDFTLAYTANYNVVKNTVQKVGDNNFYNHTASFRFNYIFRKHLVFNTNVTHNYYTAFSGTGDQSYFLWNAYIGYKLLKSRALEARITAYDILKQNRSINRTVTDVYVENSNTQVLQRYFMLQLTYTLRSFKGSGPAPASDTERPNDIGERPHRSRERENR
jgi:hypothetical protein